MRPLILPPIVRHALRRNFTNPTRLNSVLGHLPSRPWSSLPKAPLPATKPGLTILGKEYFKPKAPYADYSKGFSTLSTDLKTQDRYIINQTISTDAAQDIADDLVDNRSCNNFVLSQCRMSKESFTKILNAVGNNLSIRCLSLGKLEIIDDDGNLLGDEEIATITHKALENNNLISEFLFYCESPEAGTIFNQIKTEICGRNEEFAKTLHSLASMAYVPRVVKYLKSEPPFTGDNFDSFDHDKKIMAFALKELVSSHDDIATLCHHVKLPFASGRIDSLKDHDGQKWKALFDGSFTSEKYPGYSMRTLVGAADLIAEGDDLAHCSGSKVDNCMTSSYQVVSIRGSSHLQDSTALLKVDLKEKKILIESHDGRKRNGSFLKPEPNDEFLNEFITLVNSGILKIDWKSLEADYFTRSSESSASFQVGSDVNDESKLQEVAKETTRNGVPTGFKDKMRNMFFGESLKFNGVTMPPIHRVSQQARKQALRNARAKEEPTKPDSSIPPSPATSFFPSPTQDHKTNKEITSRVL